MKHSTRPRPDPGRGRRLAWAVLLMPAVSCCAGCGGSLTSAGYSASGEVTWKGQPLDHGTIQFVPEAGKRGMVGTEISGGSYTLPNPPGLTPGKYRVRINSRSGGGNIRDAELIEPTSRELIPREYNDETSLAAEVTPGGTRSFDFTLSGERTVDKTKPGRPPATKAARPRN